MRAVDTNLLVRIVARDDPSQREVAKGILEAGDVLVLPTVLIEAEWVLRASYGLPRVQIAEGLGAICSQVGVVTVSANAVAATLAAYTDSGDFADLLHFALAAEAGATAFVTFDRDFARPSEGGPVLEIV